MNCEKCKNKKATVFYADETGRRHSLCSSCAATLGRVTDYDPSPTDTKGAYFLPDSSLLSLSCQNDTSPLFSCADTNEEAAVCPSCSTSLVSLVAGGIAGCPECYTVFSDLLYPTALTPENARGARMPSSRRESIERIRSISELRSKIKLAVESENYELAASLRDEVRRLESSKRTQ